MSYGGDVLLALTLTNSGRTRLARRSAVILQLAIPLDALPPPLSTPRVASAALATWASESAARGDVQTVEYPELCRPVGAPALLVRTDAFDSLSRNLVAAGCLERVLVAPAWLQTAGACTATLGDSLAALASGCAATARLRFPRRIVSVLEAARAPAWRALRLICTVAVPAAMAPTTGVPPGALLSVPCGISSSLSDALATAFTAPRSNVVPAPSVPLRIGARPLLADPLLVGQRFVWADWAPSNATTMPEIGASASAEEGEGEAAATAPRRFAPSLFFTTHVATLPAALTVRWLAGARVAVGHGGSALGSGDAANETGELLLRLGAPPTACDYDLRFALPFAAAAGPTVAVFQLPAPGEWWLRITPPRAAVGTTPRAITPVASIVVGEIAATRGRGDAGYCMPACHTTAGVCRVTRVPSAVAAANVSMLPQSRVEVRGDAFYVSRYDVAENSVAYGNCSCLPGYAGPHGDAR